VIIIILNNNHLISIASILCDNVKLLQKREKVYGKEIFLHLLFLSLSFSHERTRLLQVIIHYNIAIQ